MNRSFFLVLAACLYAFQRLGHAFPVLRPARVVLARVSLGPDLRSTGSATGRPALFVGFSRRMPAAFVRIATTIGSTPHSRSSTATAPRLPIAGRQQPTAARSGLRSPRFRRDPFVRDRVSDLGRAPAPRIAASDVLPSTLRTVSASAAFPFAAQSPTPHNCCVRFAAVVTFRNATLATRRALPLTCTGLPPAGSRQLRLAHPIQIVALQLSIPPRVSSCAHNSSLYVSTRSP